MTLQEVLDRPDLKFPFDIDLVPTEKGYMGSIHNGERSRIFRMFPDKSILTQLYPGRMRVTDVMIARTGNCGFMHGTMVPAHVYDNQLEDIALYAYHKKIVDRDHQIYKLTSPDGQNSVFVIGRARRDPSSQYQREIVDAVALQANEEDINKELIPYDYVSPDTLMEYWSPKHIGSTLEIYMDQAVHSSYEKIEEQIMSCASKYELDMREYLTLPESCKFYSHLIDRMVSDHFITVVRYNHTDIAFFSHSMDSILNLVYRYNMDEINETIEKITEINAKADAELDAAIRKGRIHLELR